MCYLENMDILSKVKATIAEHELITHREAVLVALSGGSDSVVLLHLLVTLRDEMRLRLEAVYINHQIRIDAVGKEEKFCQELCNRFGLKLTIISEDIPARAKELGKGLEEAARDFRYETFEQLAEKEEFQRVALGHHLDDRAETVLFRVIRGSGLTGLKGIPVKRGRIIRPLFEISKAEILDYLEQQKLTYCVDESNRDDGFKRNFIRNQLLPLIRENLNSSVNRALVSLSETAGEDEAYLNEVVAKTLRKVVSRSPGGKIELDLTKFNSYDKWLRRRLLRCCLAELSGSSESSVKEVVDRLDRLCQGEGKAASLPNGLESVMTGDRLVIFSRVSPEFSSDLVPGRSCRLKSPELRFSSSVKSRQDVSLQWQKRSRRVWLDYDKILPPLEVRAIQAGDRFDPLGMNGSKKVGDYLTDRKVEPVYRDEIPVISDRKGIIWLVGYEIADRVKVDQSTRKVLKIEVSQPRQYRVQAV